MTAVTRLLEYFIEQNDNGATHWCVHDLIAQLYMAKEREKEQIIDAFDYGDSNLFIDKDGEQYYKETYEQD